MGQTTQSDVNAQNDQATRHNETGNRRGKSSRPVRFRLIDKDGIRHGTYKDSKEAAKQAEEIGLGEPNMSDDEPDGWYLESTKFKAPKVRRIQVAGAK